MNILLKWGDLIDDRLSDLLGLTSSSYIYEEILVMDFIGKEHRYS